MVCNPHENISIVFAKRKSDKLALAGRFVKEPIGEIRFVIFFPNDMVIGP